MKKHHPKTSLTFPDNDTSLTFPDDDEAVHPKCFQQVATEFFLKII